MKTQIVLDCDPANDDALAIIAAAGHPDIELLAVTTVAGHLTADGTAHNGAITARIAGLDTVPVARGSHLPLMREQILAGVLDHEQGLDRHRDDLPRVDLDDRHAVDLMGETFAKHRGATLVMTGPLTNLAVALRRHPDLVAHIGRVVTLGGSWGLGNKSAAAEFNILCDPEAAAIVYGAGLDLTMIPVDATGQVAITPDLQAAIGEVSGDVSEFASELLASLVTTHRSGPGPLAASFAALHDPVAVLLAARPGLGRTLRARVDIETRGLHTYGRSVVDFAGRSSQPPNADVVVSLDPAEIHAELIAAVRAVAQATTDRGAFL